MRGLAGTLALVLALAAAPPAEAYHGEACSGTGAQPAVAFEGGYAFGGVLDAANGFPQDGGRPHKWTMTLEPGTHFLALEGTDPWPSFVVCRIGAAFNLHTCEGHFYWYPWFPSTCALGVSWSGSPIECWGTAPCDFVLYVFYTDVTIGGDPAGVPAEAYAGAVA